MVTESAEAWISLARDPDEFECRVLLKKNQAIQNNQCLRVESAKARDANRESAIG